MHFNSAGASSSEPSVRIPVDVRRFPWIRRLAADYAYDFGAVAPFFSGDPAQRAAWAGAIARAQAHDHRRREIADVIVAQQGHRHAPPSAVDAARRLADPRTVAILTGQQAGLFGGPLFTLLKALTALKLAEQVSRDHNIPAIAIFWIDAEDHDWEEIRSCTVFDADLTSRTVSLPPRPGAEPAPVATIKLDDAVVGVLDETERVLPPTAFREDLLAELRRSYAPGTGMADAFGQWLEQVLGGLPEQRPHRIPLLADDEGAVLLANGAAAPVQMKERQAVVLRVDLRMVAARRQIGSGQRRELRGLPRHRQLAREDAARQRLRGWIR